MKMINEKKHMSMNNRGNQSEYITYIDGDSISNDIPTEYNI